MCIRDRTDSGGVIFHVEGLLLARKYMDFDSVPDSTGRRWVHSHHIFDGDHMIVKSAMKKAKMPDYDEWRKIEYDVERKIEDNPKYDDLSFNDRMKIIKKELMI